MTVLEFIPKCLTVHESREKEPNPTKNMDKDSCNLALVRVIRVQILSPHEIWISSMAGVVQFWGKL